MALLGRDLFSSFDGKAQTGFEDLAALRDRQLSGRRRPSGYEKVWKRACIAERGYQCVCTHGLSRFPDHALGATLRFAETSSRAHIFGLSTEDGKITLADCRRSIDGSAQQCQPIVAQWKLHDNAIFDFVWAHRDSQIVTASGDQTVKIFDVRREKVVRQICGHQGSVKSVSVFFEDHSMFASSSRDGSVRVYDTRAPLGQECVHVLDKHEAGTSLKPFVVADGRP